MIVAIGGVTESIDSIFSRILLWLPGSLLKDK